MTAQARKKPAQEAGAERLSRRTDTTLLGLILPGASPFPWRWSTEGSEERPRHQGGQLRGRSHHDSHLLPLYKQHYWLGVDCRSRAAVKENRCHFTEACLARSLNIPSALECGGKLRQAMSPRQPAEGMESLRLPFIAAL